MLRLRNNFKSKSYRLMIFFASSSHGDNLNAQNNYYMFVAILGEINYSIAKIRQ